MYPYGIVGNCQVSALVSKLGSLDWLCFPRPDSEPVFGRLLDPDGGSFWVEPVNREITSQGQQYVENTNILETVLRLSDGSAVRITDFCPRFEQHGQINHPIALARIVEPLSGNPPIRINCLPVSGWSKEQIKPLQGDHCLQYQRGPDILRLFTTASVTHLMDGLPLELTERQFFYLTMNATVETNLAQLIDSYLALTERYWRTWVKHCSIPTLFQRETIRSALVLKLQCYNDTGAILAAPTTSLPEQPGSGRNWDYRFCWLRDAYFVLSAFHNLGHFEEMEGFLSFLLTIVEKSEASKERLGPVYTLSHELPLPETLHPNWAGYNQESPVRSNNQAAEHIQNDVYGEMILTLAPIFFDERFFHLRTRDHQRLLNHLAGLCRKIIGLPDAGPWELRNGWREHAFSNLMAWAGLERLERIQKLGYANDNAIDLSQERARAQAAIERVVVSGSLRNGPSDETTDATLALLAILRYPNPEITDKTLRFMMEQLVLPDGDGSFFYRYTRKDDFGTPQSAFVASSFWIAHALAALGRKEEAGILMRKALAAANHLGLYSEHYLPSKREQRGNFPQAYSHVGLINAAFAISPPWEEVL